MGKLSNFIMIPKEWHEEYYTKGEINLHELLVLMWLPFLTNPVNGFAIISYAQLEQEFKGKLTQEYLRKIISNLRFHNLLWFEDRRGHRGSFQVWVKDYVRSSGYINNLEEIKIHNSKRDADATQILSVSQVDTNFDNHIHNLPSTEMMSEIDNPRPSESSRFTTSYTEKETKTDNNIDSIGEILKKSFSLKDLRKDLEEKKVIKPKDTKKIFNERLKEPPITLAYDPQK